MHRVSVLSPGEKIYSAARSLRWGLHLLRVGSTCECITLLRLISATGVAYRSQPGDQSIGLQQPWGISGQIKLKCKDQAGKCEPSMCCVCVCVSMEAHYCHCLLYNVLFFKQVSQRHGVAVHQLGLQLIKSARDSAKLTITKLKWWACFFLPLSIIKEPVFKKILLIVSGRSAYYKLDRCSNSN